MAASSRQACRKAIRAVPGSLCWGILALLFVSGASAAQSTNPANVPVPPPSAAACDWLVAVGAQSDALRSVCQYAVTLPERMPNFTCDQRTARYRSDHPSDIVTALVTYEDGKESYREVRADGDLVKDVAWLQARTWSTGQFGADVRGLFDTGNQVSFQLIDGGANSRTVTFRFEVAHQDVPLWRLRADGQIATPPYHGELRIDRKTGTLLRLNMVTDDLPDDYPLHSANVEIEYEDVAFGDGTSFVLPVKSMVNALDHSGKRNRNVLEFHNCHKFRATARMMPEASPQPMPSPSAVAPDQP